MKYSIYKLSNGVISELKESDEAQIVANVPSECGFVDGHFDPLCYRIDIATGEVIDYQPPQPSDSHEWNPESKRWQLTQQSQFLKNIDQQARNEIAKLEAQTLRYIGDSIAGLMDDEGRSRLIEIRARIAGLRSKLLR